MQKDGEHGPSAYDVAEYLRALRGSTKLFIDFHISAPASSNAPYALWVRCCAWRSDDRVGRVDVFAEGHQWPTKECRTLTALMYRLLHDLDAKVGWEEFMRTTS